MIGSFALTVTLASSLAWAAFDVVRKLAVQKVDARALLVVMSLGQLPVFAGWALFGAPLALRASYLVPGLASIVINAAASLLYLESVRISPLSVTIPLLSLTPALSALAGVILIGEVPHGLKLVGIGLVVLGALFLHNSPLQLVREKGSLYMALVAVLWSLSPAVDKLALEHATAVVHAAIQTGGVALVMLGVLVVRGGLAQLRTVRSAPAVVAAAMLVGAAALATQLLALGAVMVSVFEAVKRGIGMSLSVVSGRLWFGEPVTLAKLLAISMMGIGIVLVAAG